MFQSKESNRSAKSGSRSKDRNKTVSKSFQMKKKQPDQEGLIESNDSGIPNIDSEFKNNYVN